MRTIALVCVLIFPAWTAASPTSDLFSAATVGSVKGINKAMGKGAKIDDQNSGGWTALHVAAKNGHTDVGRVLIDTYHADVDFPDYGGWTPAHVSAYYGSDDFFALLLRHDVNLSLRTTNSKKTPRQIASRYKFRHIVALIDEHKLAKPNTLAPTLPVWAEGNSFATLLLEGVD